jgi:hypothetical protein
MICLQRISDESILRSWSALPSYFACPIGEVHGATVGWENGDYRLIEVPDAEPSPPSKAQLKDYAAAKRYTVETGGTVLDGNMIHTNRDSRSNILAEFVAIGVGLRPDPSPWKFGNGFALLSNEQMVAVVHAARAHVAAAFAVEASVIDEIEAGSITTFAEIDAADWPSNT